MNLVENGRNVYLIRPQSGKWTVCVPGDKGHCLENGLCVYLLYKAIVWKWTMCDVPGDKAIVEMDVCLGVVFEDRKAAVAGRLQMVQQGSDGFLQMDCHWRRAHHIGRPKQLEAETGKRKKTLQN